MGDLELEARKIGDLLRGKTLKEAKRHRPTELVLEFDDGTRLYVDKKDDGLEFSITGGCSD